MGTNFDEEGNPEGSDDDDGTTEGDSLRAQAHTMATYAQAVRAILHAPFEEWPGQIEVIARSLDGLTAQLREQATVLDKKMISSLRRAR